MSRVCFFCATPFHIAVASAITISNHYEADLFVFNEFSNCSELITRINTCDIFTRVNCVNNEVKKYDYSGFFNRIYLHIRMMLLYAGAERLGKKIIGEKPEYDIVYIFHREHAYIKSICIYLKKHCPLISIKCYEDGIGSYCDYDMYRERGISKVFERIYLKTPISANDLEISVFSPELYRLGFADNPPIKTVSSIAGFNSIPQFNQVLTMIYGPVSTEDVSNKVMFLDTVRSEELTLKGCELLDQILELVSDASEDFIIKSHPREKYINNRFKYMENKTIPLECYCSQVDLSEHILITIFSSAVFTPKTMYNQEPYVLFLYELFSEFFIDKKLNRKCLSDHLRDLYGERQKVIIPKTVEELKHELLKIL